MRKEIPYAIISAIPLIAHTQTTAFVEISHFVDSLCLASNARMMTPASISTKPRFLRDYRDYREPMGVIKAGFKRLSTNQHCQKLKVL